MCVKYFMLMVEFFYFLVYLSIRLHCQYAKEEFPQLMLIRALEKEASTPILVYLEHASAVSSHTDLLLQLAVSVDYYPYYPEYKYRFVKFLTFLNRPIFL